MFRAEVQTRLERLLAKHSLQRDVEGAIETYFEIYEDVIGATQGQWALFEAIVDDLAIADRVIAHPELEMVLQYVEHPPVERVDDEEIALSFPFDRFPEGTEALCTETGIVVALEGAWTPGDYSEVDALLVSTGEPKPGEAGTKQYVVITRESITTFDDPLGYLDALLDGA